MCMFIANRYIMGETFIDFSKDMKQSYIVFKIYIKVCTSLTTDWGVTFGRLNNPSTENISNNTITNSYFDPK